LGESGNGGNGGKGPEGLAIKQSYSEDNGEGSKDRKRALEGAIIHQKALLPRPFKRYTYDCTALPYSPWLVPLP